MEYYNAHTPALKLLLGGFGGEAVKQADQAYNDRAATRAYRRFDRAFHMPFMRDADRRFHISLEILDAVWCVSYLRHGRIVEDYYEEAVTACTAYLRVFLPEEVELRDATRQAIAAGEALSLTFDASGPPEDV